MLLKPGQIIFLGCFICKGLMGPDEPAIAYRTLGFVHRSRASLIIAESGEITEPDECSVRSVERFLHDAKQMEATSPPFHIQLEQAMSDSVQITPYPF